VASGRNDAHPTQRERVLQALIYLYRTGIGHKRDAPDAASGKSHGPTEAVERPA